jgi:hypothetical protein
MGAFILPPVIAFHRRHPNQPVVNGSRTLAGTTQCSTEHAPWFVIPSNHKWFRNLAISQIVSDTLASLNMKFPAPTVDIDEIKKKYHAIVEAEGGEEKSEAGEEKGKKGKKGKKSKKGK